MVELFGTTGQQRRNWLTEQEQRLDNALRYYLGPTGVDKKVNALAQAAEFTDAGDYMELEQARRSFADDPELASMLRMLTAGAAVAMPVVGAKMVNEGVDVAGDAWRSLADDWQRFAGDADRFMREDAGGALLDFYASRDVPDVLTDAHSLVRSSVAKDWIDPKYSRRVHPVSAIKMGDVNQISPTFDDVDRLLSPRAITIEDLQGTVLTPAFGDRTRAGGFLSGYDNISFDPIDMHGGQAFMRERGTGTWASEPGPMGAKARTVEDLISAGEDPRLIYTAMGAQGGDFSRMMGDAMVSQISRNPPPADAVAAFDARMVKVVGDKWPGIMNAEGVMNLPGTVRWAAWQEMDRAKWGQAGFPSVGKTRVALTDPQLLHADPFDTGLGVSAPTGLIDDFTVKHPTYTSQIGGEYSGDMDMVPGPLIWRDFFSGRRAAGAPTGSDQRAFMMSSPRITQRVDQQMVDEVQSYLGLNQGDGPIRQAAELRPAARRTYRPPQASPRTDASPSAGSIGPSGNYTTPDPISQRLRNLSAAAAPAALLDDEIKAMLAELGFAQPQANEVRQ